MRCVYYEEVTSNKRWNSVLISESLNIAQFGSDGAVVLSHQLADQKETFLYLGDLL